eukprot:6963363-Alexandrium_andersonii.AAC.1
MCIRDRGAYQGAEFVLVGEDVASAGFALCDDVEGAGGDPWVVGSVPVSYTHLRAHETSAHL